MSARAGGIFCIALTLLALFVKNKQTKKPKAKYKNNKKKHPNTPVPLHKGFMKSYKRECLCTIQTEKSGLFGVSGS